MKFDKSKIYTAANADEVKVGSEGYFADNMADLEETVINEDVNYFSSVRCVNLNRSAYCFHRESLGGDFALFYLVNEPEGKKFRPYKDTDEMIEDFKRRCEPYGGWRGKNNPMYCPLIWVVGKDTQNKNLITFYSDCRVYIASSLTDLKILFNNFTYLDGSPVGAEI